MHTSAPTSRPFEVLIAGGGVAALETLMALRATAGDDVSITLLAPEREFRYRPMAVAEPFTIAHARHFALDRIVADFGATLVQGSVANVHPRDHFVATGTHRRLDYDALVVACGARPHPALPGAITIDDRNLGATLRGLVQDIEEGYVRDVAFVAPPGAFWPLPLYELALMTAHRAFDMGVRVELSVVTPEHAPLEVFGTEASEAVTTLLTQAGIAFHGSASAELEGGWLTLAPHGTQLRVAQVVALPALEGPHIPGITGDAGGFLPIDAHCTVRGVEDIYAAGDVTSYPIKHGGIAAQQADTIAATIAARVAGAPLPSPLQPVIRGVLLTGHGRRYIEARPAAGGGFTSTFGETSTWAPRGKIAAEHLGRYLAEQETSADADPAAAARHGIYA
jgi:sulfide:quinone oxidoreductase